MAPGLDFLAFNYYGAGCAKYVDVEEGEKLIAEAKAAGGIIAFMTGLMTYPGLAANVSNPLQTQTSYGLIYVDRDEFALMTMNRYRKDSFYWYQKVCRSNGAGLD